MPFGIPVEDFHGGFGLPDLSKEDNHIIESAYRPVNIEVVCSELVGECPKCGRHVTESACNYCPRCGTKLDWE